jgi:uncharacterized membrane protein YedE/YeeE
MLMILSSGARLSELAPAFVLCRRHWHRYRQCRLCVAFETRRFIVAFIGGALAMYGARMAGGCTSGNGISQSLQLAVVGWTFLAVMFVSGAITAAIVYRGSRSNGSGE